MIQKKITDDLIEGRPAITYDRLRLYLETYEREAVPDASERYLRRNDDPRSRPDGREYRTP